MLTLLVWYVLKDCPTLRYYTYTDAQKILTGLMSQIKDRNSAEYKKICLNERELAVGS